MAPASTSFPALTGVAIALSTALASNGQSPINAPGAMQPSTGTGVVHPMFLYRKLGDNPTNNEQSVNEFIALAQIAYGLSSTFSLQFDAPLIYRDIRLSPSGSEDEFNIADMTLLAKYRLYQDDSAATNTTRFSVIGGLQIPGQIDYVTDSSNDAWDPIIGGVFSTVQGRHGFNASALWEFYTGDADEVNSDSLRYDVSYLFRFAPQEYTAETTSAWYAVLELNGNYGTNGESQLFLSPGVMYESRTFTLDATVMIPVWQDLKYRADVEIVIGAGIRLSF
jgi:hypothetical protein